MITVVTVEMITSCDPCYKREDGEVDVDRIRAIIGDGVSPSEALELDIPAADRVWLLTRPGVLSPEQAATFSDRAVVRAVQTHALHCGRGENVRAWATQWLDGSDRSGDAARAVRVVLEEEAAAAAEEAAEEEEAALLATARAAAAAELAASMTAGAPWTAAASVAGAAAGAAAWAAWARIASDAAVRAALEEEYCLQIADLRVILRD